MEDFACIASSLGGQEKVYASDIAGAIDEAGLSDEVDVEVVKHAWERAQGLASAAFEKKD